MAYGYDQTTPSKPNLQNFKPKSTKQPHKAPSMASSLLLSTPFFCHHPRNPKSPIPKVSLSSHLISPKLTHSISLTTTIHFFPKPTHFLRRRFVAGASIDDISDEPLTGEDAAVFELSSQKVTSWVYFTLILGVVLFALNFLWIDNSTGFGKDFINGIESVFHSPEVVMLSLTIIFGVVHSGLASLRNVGEKVIGERAFRVVFAGVSLPLAVSTVVYFINHRYDGIQLWQLQSVPGLHQLVWLSSFISFLFLYPSTFNLLEVAAVDKPKLHLWETGIMRITRHPQMVGQAIWCLAHTVWIGNSVAVAASIGLIGHHLFGVWNGDRRLALRYGDAFEIVKKRTSVFPFAAILDGRQRLPKDYYKEFLRVPYIAVTAVTLGAYFAHPIMQSGSFRLHW